MLQEILFWVSSESSMEPYADLITLFCALQWPKFKRTDFIFNSSTSAGNVASELGGCGCLAVNEEEGEYHTVAS